MLLQVPARNAAPTQTSGADERKGKSYPWRSVCGKDQGIAKPSAADMAWAGGKAKRDRSSTPGGTKESRKEMLLRPWTKQRSGARYIGMARARKEKASVSVTW